MSRWSRRGVGTRRKEYEMRCFSAGSGSISLPALLVALVAVALCVAAPISAQPFDVWLHSTPGYPTTHGFIQIPHSASLNPTGGFTFEAWVFEQSADGVGGENCTSVAGKNHLQAWWIGVCNVGGLRTLRSYLKGAGSLLNGGRVAVNQW